MRAQHACALNTAREPTTKKREKTGDASEETREKIEETGGKN